MKVLKSEKRKREVATVPNTIKFTKQLSVTVTASRKMSELEEKTEDEENKIESLSKPIVMSRPKSK